MQADDLSCTPTDGLLAVKRIVQSLRGTNDPVQLFLGGPQQRFSFPRPFVGKHRIAAEHEPLAGEFVFGRDLGKVRLDSTLNTIPKRDIVRIH